MDVVLDRLMQESLELVNEFVGLLPRLLVALVVLVVAVGMGRIAARGLRRILVRTDFSGTHRAFFGKVAVWTFALVGLYLGLTVLEFDGVATGLLAGGGITAVVLGFAFREIGENFLAGFFLAFGRPFEVGDLIRSGDLEGVVRGVDVRHTHIRTADGRDIYIPSARIFNDPLINYTKDGLRRPSFTVGIDYRDDVEAARQELLRTVRAVPGVLAQPAPAVVIADLGPQYVELQVTFWAESDAEELSLANLRSRVMDASREGLARGGFTFSSEVTTGLVGGEGRPFRVELSGEVPTATTA